MKAMSNDPKTSFSCCVPRAPEKVLEGLKVLGMVVVTVWVPTLLYCTVIGAMPSETGG